MKKLFAIIAVSMMTIGQAAAQFGEGFSTHLGVGAGVGSEGFNIEIATSVSRYVAIRAGVNLMPNFKIKETANLELGSSLPSGFSDEVKVEGGLKRTTVDLKVDVYPFRSSFFITGGFSFGGADVIKITGQYDDYQRLVELLEEYPYINIGDDIIRFNESGKIVAGARVKKVRPYVGLGFGRAVQKKRLGVRVEAGVQFEGKPELYYKDSTGRHRPDFAEGDDDDIQKVLDVMRVYPCLKVTLRGRIF